MSMQPPFSPLTTPPATIDGHTAPDRSASPRTTVRFTAADGTVLIEVSRHVEHPAEDGRGGSDEAPLVVVDVVGDIDLETVPLLLTVLTRAIGRNRRVCCDMSRVGFAGAAAAHALAAALCAADETGCVFTVRGVHGSSARVLQITGLAAALAARA